MAGYTRNDTTDQIANGNTIDAVPLDGEFNAIQGAFASTGGHKHDGSTGEGAPITVIGPAQDVVASSNSLSPKADDAQDLGTSSLEWRNLWIDGTANIDSLVADTVDINAGTIDGTVIGGSSAAAITGTTITASGDVVVADKIVHTGDTNTAIRFPAADTVTIETSGAERLRVDSSGNIGIGTTTPGGGLHIQSGSANRIRLQGFAVGNPGGGFISWNGQDGTRKAYVGHSSFAFDDFYIWNEANTSLRFATNNLERLRIHPSGGVAIGSNTDPGDDNLFVAGTVSVGDASTTRTNLGAQATITGAATSVTLADLTASRALVSDASGKIAASSITATELGNLSGSSSNLQTQINSIVAGQLNITGAASTIDTENLTINRAVVSDAAGKIAVSAATSAQVGYLSNVTSDIQTQINNKQNFDAGLQSIAGLSTSANQMLYTTAADTYATTGLTAAGRTLIAAADDVAQRTALGLGSLATQTGTFSGTSSGTNTGDQNIFRNVAVAGQSTIVADTTTDTLTFASGSGITITTDATTDTVTFSATGSGGTVSSVDVSGGTTGLTTSGGPVTGSGTITLAGTLTVANGGTGATSAVNARTNLGLGTLSTQAASAVSITGGSISGITDLAILDGGTGASDALTARANLGVAIGSNVQAWDANLDQIAALIPTADNFIVGNGTAWVQETPAQVLTSLGITSTAAELNKLDGVTAVAADLNILAGQAAAGLIGTELGYVNGVTSNIQTQLDGKVDNTSLAGSVVFFARNTAPSGWLKANGAAVSRTTYATLFAAIGTTFGTGDGSTTFNLPDLRGEFVRGWDDARGVDSGRAFGSSQSQAIESHSHTVNDPGHSHTTNARTQFSSGSTSDQLATNSSIQYPVATINSATTGITVNAAGGAETRPRNIALLACIKF